MNKIKNIFSKRKAVSAITTILAISVFVVLVFAVAFKNNSILRGHQVNIESLEGDKYLLSKKEIKRMIDNQLGFELEKALIDDLNLMALESILNNDSRIKRADVYLSKNNVLNVEVSQRKPIYRINRTGKAPFYMDADGSRISVKRSVKTIRVPVVTGRMDPYRPDFKEKKSHNLNEIHKFFLEIQNDEFMSALVEQLHINDEGQYILIPKLGDKKIILGSMDDLGDKIKNLKTYYRQVGLDDFKVLDLRFKDQVVGRT